MIRKCDCFNCNKEIGIHKGVLSTLEPGVANPQRINVIKPAFKHHITSYNRQGKPVLEIKYFCWDCEMNVIEAMGGK